MSRLNKFAQKLISALRLSLRAYIVLGGSLVLCTVNTTQLDNTNNNEQISQKENKSSTEKSPDAHTETWITVFVHGIKSVRPHLSASNFLKFMRDDIEDTVYSRTIDLMRRDPHFYKNQVMQGLGLQKINPHDVHKGYAAGAMAYLFEEVFKELDTPQTNNNYYTFGWSGLLSPSMRFKDGVQLFMELEKEVDRYKTLYKVTPKVRVIAYSHGGNVCLNLGAAHQQLFPRSDLIVDELILVGVPIQPETDYLVADPVFKRIYHFYSLADRIQKLDCFSFDRMLSFSRRHFVRRSDFTPPNNLFQIQLKVLRNTHTIDTRKKRRAALAHDFTKTSIISGRSHLFRDISPGHTELWFFGWAPQHYREHFPLNPLPNIAFAPMIIHEIKKVEDKLPVPHPFIVDIRPEQEVFLIKRTTNKLVSTSNFVTQEKLTALKEYINQYRPDNYTVELYNDHMYAAYEHALVIHTRDNKKKNPRAHIKAVKKQEQKATMRINRRKHKKIEVIENPDDTSFEIQNIATGIDIDQTIPTRRRGRKRAVITSSKHKEINCPFCYDPEIQKYLTI